MRADKGSRAGSISRRHLLTSAAGASAAVVVTGVAGTAAAGTATATSAPSAGGAAAEAGGPVVVHLRDLASGAMDVFSGTERIQILDRALADRIARAADPDQTNRSL
jgi:hypothetical protein